MDIKKTALFTRPIAHRGLHNDDIPENSIPAFVKAIEAGYPIELDVRAIDDGSIIVFHDDKMTRLTDQNGYACCLTKQDIEKIRLMNTDVRIPYFSEVLELVDGKVPLLIEIKNEGKVGALEHDTLQLLKNYKGEYAVQSFNPYSVEYFKKNAPHVPRGQLSSFFDGASLSFVKRFVLKRMRLNKVSSPDFISYDARNLPNKYVTKADLPTLAWTIRSNADYEKVKPYCDNIIFEGFTPEKD